jgi:hypothetical protein
MLVLFGGRKRWQVEFFQLRSKHSIDGLRLRKRIVEDTEMAATTPLRSELNKIMLRRSDSDGEIVRLARTYDWRTTDPDEIKLRQQRAREEQPRIRNLEPAHNIFSQFEVVSKSGMTYTVELRCLSDRAFSCTCTDFRVNGLGTCKHVEAVLLNIEARFPKIFADAQQNGSDRIDVVCDEMLNTLRIENPARKKPEVLAEYFDDEGLM